MKSLMLLFDTVLRQCGTRCCTSTQRDLETVHARVENEGFSFITISLPAFCRDFERCLDKENVEPSDFFGYKKSGSIPCLFKGMIRLVFDQETGALLDDPDPVAVQAIRQICLLFSKVELPCSENRVRSAYAGYIKCEQDVAAWSWSVDLDYLRSFARIGTMIFGTIFSKVEHDMFTGELVPCHGPGATADGLKGNLKFTNNTWTQRLEQYFPFLDFSLGSYRDWEDCSAVDFLEPGAEIPVKVITVPKTLKTPRIIAVEPTCMQYAQQALSRSLRRHILLSARVKRMLNPEDQRPNQDAAFIGSVDGSLATLDLSEASDRVSNLHAQFLLLNHPHLDGAVQACRSLRADVPGYGTVSLSKFASMGSALTFPIESMVFLTIVFMGIERAKGTTLTQQEINSLSWVVRVFGDDIIVPKEYVQSVISELNLNGFVVNESKSFWNGKFRESCGAEYYMSSDVTVTRMRRPLRSLTELDASELSALVSARNQFYERGWWDTARWIDGVVSRAIPYYPTVHKTSRAIGRHTFLNYQVDRVGGRYQRPEVRALYRSDVIPSSYIDDTPALLKCLLRLNDGLQTVTGEDHLYRAGRPLAATLKRGWVSPY